MKPIMGMLIAATAVIASTPSAAATITFEPRAGTFNNTPAVFSEAGYTLAYTPAPGGFSIVGSSPGCSPACSSSGSNAFYSFNSGSLTITATDGSLFSLSSFLAATTFTTINRELSILLTGVSAGGPVSTTVGRAAGAADSFSTYAPVGFTNLSSLTFSSAPGASSPEFALDNIVLNAAAVPEPASWAMMILGMGAVGGTLRRRSKVSTAVKFA